MQDKIFIDSNIWLYAFMQDDSNKKEKAISLISKSNIILSTQVINEVCFNLLKKADYSEIDLQSMINNINRRYQVTLIDEKVILKASQIRMNYNISFWDSFIISSALDNDCGILYSEDMHHNLKIEDKMIVKNPFQS